MFKVFEWIINGAFRNHVVFLGTLETTVLFLKKGTTYVVRDFEAWISSVRKIDPGSRGQGRPGSSHGPIID